MIEDSKRDVPKYNGMVDGVKKIVAEEGIGGLYRGVGPVVSFPRHFHVLYWDRYDDLTLSSPLDPFLRPSCLTE